MKRLALLPLLFLSCAPMRLSPLPLQRYADTRQDAFTETLKKEYRLTFPGKKPHFEIGEITTPGKAAVCGGSTITLDHYKLARKGVGPDADRILYHELVHANNFAHRKRMFMAPYLAQLPEELVEEGTAEYIADSIMKIKLECHFRDMEKDYYRFDRAVYDVGYCMTGPVIDRYKEEGIIYMLTHLPTEEEIRDPYLYPSRMLREIELTRSDFIIPRLSARYPFGESRQLFH